MIQICHYGAPGLYGALKMVLRGLTPKKILEDGIPKLRSGNGRDRGNGRGRRRGSRGGSGGGRWLQRAQSSLGDRRVFGMSGGGIATKTVTFIFSERHV